MLDARAAERAGDAGIRAALDGGVDWLQVRDRSLEGAALLALVDDLCAAARAGRAAHRVIVNRRLDVALAAGADGVQLGFDAAPADAARALLGKEARIGVSTHAPEEVLGAPGSASHAQLAPIFAPLSKAGDRPALGLTSLSRACGGPLPVLAQGGIDASRAGACIAAGAAGVAVSGAISSAPDPGRAARGLREALDA